MNKFAIGIDLHGTLLNSNWDIEKETQSEIIRLLNSLTRIATVYICTGNDLSFTQNVLPVDLLRKFTGFILESGGVLSDGYNEKIIVSQDELQVIAQLNNELSKENWKDCLFKGRRLASISLFTKYREDGVSPDRLFHSIKKWVDKSVFKEKVRVTHSDVAVDIIPATVNKYTGLKRASHNSNIIAIADSYNDYEFILNSDYAFTTGNYSKKLVACLEKHNMTLKPLPLKNIERKKFLYKSENPYTEGVVEILKYLDYSINFI